MRLFKAIAGGLKPGRETLMPALLFWLGGLLPAWMAAGPLRTGLHAALDRSSVAPEISSGGGVDLLIELVMHEPGLWAAGFALFLPAMLLGILLEFFVASGTYARAASPEGSVWRNFWGQAVSFFLPAAVVVLLSGILWGVVALLPGAVIGGIGVASKDATDPGFAWTLFRVGVLCAFVVIALFRGGAGFGRAWCALAGRTTNPARAFLKGTGFALRHLPQTQALTWFFGVLRVLVVVAPLLWLAPGFASGAAVAGTFILTQLGFLAAGYLRVSEIRSQCRYLGELPRATALEAGEPPSVAPVPPRTWAEPGLEDAGERSPEPLSVPKTEEELPPV